MVTIETPPGFQMKLALVLIALVILAGLAFQASRRPQRSNDPIKRRVPLTNREQTMYHRLRGALPKHIILAQVSHGALLSSRSHATRNRFSQKIADFVVCTPAFDVAAVIELDDASHRTKRRTDAERDAMLTNAGLHIIRYANIPDAETIIHDINRAESRALDAPAQRAPVERPGTHDGTAKTAATRATRDTPHRTIQRSNPAQ